MDIITAWKLESGDERPWLVSAYDEVTQEEHNGIPDFYLKDVEAAREPVTSGSVLRELLIRIPDEHLDSLFLVPGVRAEVVSGRDL